MTRDPSRDWTGGPRRRAQAVNAPVKGPAGTATATATATGTATAEPTPAVAAAIPVGREAHANLHVKGLKGTLNTDDVHQALEARQRDFDQCIEQSRRSLRWVSGAIRFACKVDADGRVVDLRTLTSDIGHRELERCVRTTVLTTQFPRPAGRALAEFSWGMTVEPVGGRPLDSIDPKLVAKSVRKQARALFRGCELRRRRVRFRVTAYLNADGHVLSAGAVSVPAQADDKVDCVLERVSKWSLPKPKHTSKLSFELR